MTLLGNPMKRPDTVQLCTEMRYILCMMEMIIGLHIPSKDYLI